VLRMLRIDRTRSPRRCAAAALITALAAGCASPPTSLLGTDVTAVAGMSEVRATDVAISGDRLVRGRFTLHGPCDDAGAALGRASDRMLQRGWTRDGVDVDAALAAATFFKDDRTCRIEIRRNPDDPERSTATIEIDSAM